MCYAKPGPRCSNCTRVKLNRLKAWKQRLPDSPNIDEKIAVAQDEYDRTKKGIKELRAAGEIEKANEYQKEYNEAINAFKRVNGGVTTPKSQQKIVSDINTNSDESKKDTEFPQVKEVTNLRNELIQLYKEMGGTPEKPIYHNTELSETEIKAEQKLIQLGSKVDELAESFGAPTRAEWDIFKQKVEVSSAAHDAEILKIDAKRDEVNKMYHEMYKLDNNHPMLPKLQELRSEVSKLYFEKTWNKKNGTDNKAEYEELVKRRATAYISALKASGVVFTEEGELKLKAPTQDISNIVSTASTYFPKKWIEASNFNDKELKIKYAPGIRDNYFPMSATITLSSDNPSTAVHELTHRLEETNDEIGNAERLFLYRRSGFLSYQKKETRRKPKPRTVYHGRSEWGYSANLPETYMGKVYDYQNQVKEKDRIKYGTLHGHRSYELMSMGSEMIFFGKSGGGEGFGEQYREDQDYKNFVLGVFASTGK